MLQAALQQYIHLEVTELARMKKAIPEYKTVIYNGIQYYRTRIEDADGKRVAIYGKTREELYEKVQEAKRQIEEASFRRDTPHGKGVLRKMASNAISTCSSNNTYRLHI